MDLVDLEAATERSMIGNITPPESDNHRSQAPNLLVDQSPDSAKEQDARLYSVARAVVEQVLQTLPGLLRQQLRHTDTGMEMLDLASAEEHTVHGAQENVSPSHSKSGTDHGRLVPSGRKVFDRAGIDVLTNAEDEADKSFREKLAEILPKEPPQNPRPSPSYTQEVAIMTAEDIEAENRARREVRQKWRGAEDWEYLEDPWKHIQRDDEPFFNNSTHEQRKGLQLDLIDALLSRANEPRLDRFLGRGLPFISCWISLIGTRLGNIFIRSDGAVIQAEVLIECIWTCKSISSARVCDVLQSCFRRGILEQPPFGAGSDFSESMSDLRSCIAMVHVAIFLLNILHKHELSQLEDQEGLEDTWLLPLSIVERAMRHQWEEVNQDHDGGVFFSVGDFGLKDLQSVGGLQIRWTAYLDEHLELYTEGKLTILKLYWFSPVLTRFFRTAGLCGGSRILKRAEEVGRSLDLILNPHGNQDKAKAQYQSLEAPEWLRLLALDSVGTRRSETSTVHHRFPLSQFQIRRPSGKPRFCYEVADHLISPEHSSPAMERITSTTYPFYCTRLKELRFYMDSRQPRGLRALWKDRRNSNLFYTFWLVIAFGAIELGLGFGTLAVGILQAWSQLKSSHNSV